MRIQRTLAPAAAPITLHDLLNGIAGLCVGDRFLEKITDEMRGFFGVKHVFLVSSGKAALTLVLLSLKSLSPRRQVLIPAYTCFSVPSAIVKAGLSVSLCDIDPEALDFRYDLLEQGLTNETLCVIPTHLFGLPAKMSRVNSLAKAKGAFVVEDAAQAMGGEQEGRPLGTLGDVGILSLGRGKNITCGSGGVILTDSDIIAEAIGREFSTLKMPAFLERTGNLLQVLATYLFIYPTAYWLPASLPFLRLGETKFFTDFPIHRLDGVRAGLLSNWKGRLEESNRIRLALVKAFAKCLFSNDSMIPHAALTDAICLRLPVLMPNRVAKEAVCALSRNQGLGISPSYPSGIHEIGQLQHDLGNQEYPGATMVADRLVTLPLHHLLNAQDQERISSLITSLATPTTPAHRHVHSISRYEATPCVDRAAQ